MKRTWRPMGLTVALAAALSFATGSPARAIVVSDEPNDHVVLAPADYDRVGLLLWQGSPGSTAVLIDPWHILTARHAIGPGGLSDHEFELHLADGTHVYQIAARSLHPTIDIAVARLDRSAGLPGYGLYRQSSEVNEEAVLVGYGVSGTGLTGPDDANYPRGTKRFGYNRIDAIGTDGSGYFLVTDFDGPNAPGPYGPGTLGADKEVMPAAGDSGGPTFVDDGGDLLVAGVHVGLSDENGSGTCPDFGDVNFDVRISEYTAWIDAQIPEYKTLTLNVKNGTRDHVGIEPQPTDRNQPEFPAGIEVVLTADPNGDKVWSRWKVFDPNHPDDANYIATDTNAVLYLTMDADWRVKAIFKCGSGLGVLGPVVVIGIPICGFAARRASHRR